LKVIYAIPGLGTTSELFAKITVPGYQLRILEWPVPDKARTIREYAKEFLKMMDLSAPVNLLGVSFGGMLCCELADLVKVDKLVLISSCKNRRELPGILKFLKAVPLHHIFSDKHYRALAAHSRWIIGFDRSYMPEYLKMVHSMPRNYFIRCFDMIVTWEREQNSHAIYHLHGSSDRLLPYRNIKNFHTIAGGTHAMVVQKAEEINLLLNKEFNGLQGPSETGGNSSI
jgi:pimeloyl-ACP methyl ester carboxylesterase